MKKSLRATHYALELEGEHLPIVIRRHPSSRRMVIRYQPRSHTLSLTLPRYVTIRQGLRFVEEKRAWIALQLKGQPGRVPFADGEIITVFGAPYRLKHVGGRGVVRIEGDAVFVPGEAAFMERRVREWLKAQASEAITRLAQEKAAILDKKITRIVFRDTSSHWGSCTRGGRLSFSWRLALAPFEILEYVVCHEVAHLAHLNHGEAFWDTVAELYPRHAEARAWLRKHGHSLYIYG